MNPEQHPFLFIVDDEADQLDLMERAAKRTGRWATVHAVTDSQLAYHQLLEACNGVLRKPDLIIMDWKMPRMHGSELACALHAHPELRDIPLVVFSSSDYSTDRQMALETGCRAFHQKPARFKELVQLLSDLGDKYCPIASSSALV